MSQDKEWEITDDRLVLYLDIMGFKDLVQSSPPQRLHEYLKSVTELTSQMKHMGYADLERAGEEEFPEIKSQIFSDSILFVSEGTTARDVFVLTKGAKWIITILFQYLIPFRGAFSRGVMTYDERNSIFFGQPLINSYELEQELDLYGIVAHNSFEGVLKSTFEKSKTKDSLQDFVPYPINTSKGKAKHLILDWIKFAHDIHNENFHLELYSKMSCQMSGGPRYYLDNTQSFIEECLDRPSIDREYE